MARIRIVRVLLISTAAMLVSGLLMACRVDNQSNTALGENDTPSSADSTTGTTLNAQDEVKYKTEADFLNHPDGIEFQAAAFRAAKAYLNGDSDELAGYLTDSCVVEDELDLYENVDYLIWKWSLHDMKSEDHIQASYEFKLKGDDSVSYVSMELIKKDGEWKVDFIALEK